MAPPPVFRPLRPGDAGRCAAVHSQAFASPWSPVDLREQIMRTDRIASGATEASGLLVGFAVSRFVGDEADLLTIVVDRKARKIGLATRLLGFHLSSLSGAHVGQVFLEVESQNVAAHRLYGKFGFQTINIRPAYYAAAGNTRSDAIVMRLVL